MEQAAIWWWIHHQQKKRSYSRPSHLEEARQGLSFKAFGVITTVRSLGFTEVKDLKWFLRVQAEFLTTKKQAKVDFNARLSKARACVEDALGIWATRWRLFLGTVKTGTIKAQVDEFASILVFSLHSDVETTLLAIDKYLKEISASSNAETGEKKFTLQSFDLGVRSSGNPKVDDCIRVLQLLDVAKQRVLQTQINEVLSGVQKISSNPKANLTLARMGR